MNFNCNHKNTPNLNSNSLAGWAFTNDEIHQAIVDGRVLNPSIDLSNPCNLNCPYCYVEERNSERKLRFPDELTIQEILNVVNDLVLAGAKTVNIVGAGEPTIDPHFEQIIKEISELGALPVVFTNGIRLSERPAIVDLLYDSGATIVLKYNSEKKELEDLVAGRKGYSTLRDQALEALLNRGFNSHMPTRLALDIVAFHGNVSEIPVIYDKCRCNNIFPIVTEFIPTGRTEQGEFVGQASIRNFTKKDQAAIISLLMPLSLKERRSLYRTLKIIDNTKYGIKHYSMPAYFNGSLCTQQLGLYVDIHGNIWPCVARSRLTHGGIEKSLLGNVRNGDLPSVIWKSHIWLKEIKSSYNGCCPFKAEIAPSDSSHPIIINDLETLNSGEVDGKQFSEKKVKFHP